jgi:hypothetical protein
MKWTVPILMLLILITTFTKGFVWLQYQGNKDFISKNLCVNKSRPQLHCKGKCQLMKKMADEEQENSSSPVPKLKSGFEETAIIVTTNHCRLGVEFVTTWHPFTKNSAYNSPVFPVFHPPA